MKENKQETKDNNEFEQNRPIVESKVMKSKDGRYIIHKTVITDIKPINYYKKVFD